MLSVILPPLARRVGSFVGGFLAANGITGDHQLSLVNGAVALVLVAGDIFLSRVGFLRRFE